MTASAAPTGSKAASDAGYNKLNSAEKSALKAYTGSAYSNWNDALRTGETKSSSFKSAQPMVEAFKKAATEVPEGTILWRGLGVGSATYKSVVGAIVQDGSFQSASYGDKPAFSGYQTWLRLHIGKGVRAMQATTFSHFSTSEREIILQNNVRYAIMKVENHDNYKTTGGASAGKKTIVDVLVLPHE
jgi:hypothetical protein